MRARIIFRGLTLFKFSNPTRGLKGKDVDGKNVDFGTLTALLVSDPMHHNTNGIHEHKPYLALLGRNVGAEPGPPRADMKIPIPANLTIELMGHGNASGMIVEGSFIDYVPCLYDLMAPNPGQSVDNRFIKAAIEIPRGRIRTRDFISWDWYGKSPTPVAYMDTNYQGYGADEVIVDIGDDADFDVYDPDKYLSLNDRFREEKLWPRVKGDQFDEDVDQNTVEILVTNLTARRRRPVFWGTHFQTLLQAAGYAPRAGWHNQAQFDALDSVAGVYDPGEWNSDLQMLHHTNLFHPFPFLITDPALDPLARTMDVGHTQDPQAPRNPPGRTKDDGHAGTGHDPENTQICPFGWM